MNVLERGPRLKQEEKARDTSKLEIEGASWGCL
jgi:hypothetical protein